jgi:hypothetical protein
VTTLVIAWQHTVSHSLHTTNNMTVVPHPPCIPLFPRMMIKLSFTTAGSVIPLLWGYWFHSWGGWSDGITGGWEICHCDSLRWHNIHIKFHNDRFRDSSDIKVTASRIWEAVVLVFLIGGTYEIWN